MTILYLYLESARIVAGSEEIIHSGYSRYIEFSVQPTGTECIQKLVISAKLSVIGKNKVFRPSR